jgi:hypothetical protein
MARDTDTPDYATVKLTHHAAIRERAETLRRRSGRKSSQPECLAIGHAWTEEPNRDGGSICMICQVVRFP